MRVLSFILFYLCMAPLMAQNFMLNEAFDEFSSKRFWEYEEIPITWNMEGKIQADLNEGINHLLEEEPNLAEEDFTRVLKMDSSLWEAFYFRGVARKQLRKLKLAKRDLEKALALSNWAYEPYVELAKVSYLRYDVVECERLLKKAIQADKSKAAAHYLRGDINLLQGQTHAAIRNYKDCLDTDSLFHDARMKLAIIDLIAKKNEDVAVQRLNQVLKYDSLQKNALLFRSILLYEKQPEQSARDLSNLILTSPHNLMAYYLRGTLLTKLKDYDKAFKDFQEVVKSAAMSDNEFAGQQTWTDKRIDIQNVGAYILTRVYGLSDSDALKVKQSFCHILNQEFTASVGILNQVSNAIQEPLCLYLIAVSYEHKGEHIKALQFYNLALKLDDNIADAHKKRGIYGQNLKNWTQSVEDFSAVLRLTPDAFVIYKMRGISYFYDNKFKEAIADYNTYLKHDSANVEVIGNRGMAYYKSNDRLSAYVDFSNSGNTSSFDFHDMYHLTDSVLQTGDTTKVLSYLNSFTSAAPYFTEGYALKFRIHMAQKEWNKVETKINEALRNSRIGASNDHHAFLLTLMAMNLAKHGHETDALNSFNQAIKFDKKNALAYLERGKLFREMGKEGKAKEDFKQASLLGNKQADKLLSTP